ncbi:hypothetical protein FRC04_010645 [Tulasnella sp. 424]|nr:hypothetical protein FRC04_010645 [Tulasnella sp. 424]KAG8972467.1 hypothetical protein FRC05_010060 [Tulasnella sp. 425]
MVQGKSKLAQKQKTSNRHVRKDPKKGARVIPPKKPLAISTAKIKKNLSAKINNSIEQQVVSAASSGKLTILKPSPQSTGPANSNQKDKK